MENRVLVTGGCGFIGSHLVEKLVEQGREVVVFDNLSKGKPENIRALEDSFKLKLIVGDLLDSNRLEDAIDGCGLIFHLAANPQANIGYMDTGVDFQQNIVATRNLLEAMRKSSYAKTLMFASTSTVYGDATEIPTSEDYGPLLPVSLYGASKL
jgi:UDP-glucose 4-epimerase